MRESDIQYELVSTGDCATIRRTSFVSPNDVIIDVTSDRIRVLPKLAQAVSNDKFELVPEGDMFRVVALRDVKCHGVTAGARGGLIARQDGLAQKGDCWIEENVIVLEGARVYGDAYVYGDSVLEGSVTVSGKAYVSSCQLRSRGRDRGITVSEDANVSSCNVAGSAKLIGQVRISESVIDPAEGEAVWLGQGEFVNAHLTRFYEALSLYTRHGMLSVYRGGDGRLVGNIGCQRFDTPEKLHEIAHDFSASDQEKAMIDSFFAMVRTAQEYWTSPIQEEVQES
jgi:hypothetical protein